VVALILDKHPDLVLISGYYPPLHRRLVRPLRRRGLRVGLRSDNTLAHSDFHGLKGLLKKLVLPLWLRRYTSWHPVGSLARAYLEQVAHTTRPTYLFPYNVHNDWFAREAARHRAHRGAALQRLGFPADSYVVLGILKWHEREAPLVLLRAFRQLLVTRPEARLILVGDGPLRTTVEAMIATMADKVSTPGYVAYSRLPALYALADIFVHPAPGEPWGVSVNEALACGVPVAVSTGVGAGADLVDEGRTGFVFPAGDWQVLAERLFAFSQRDDTAALRTACEEKMRHWHYATTHAAFERALSGAP
jgi:glycosyltransferase involved in cell wall biosynthesis